MIRSFVILCLCAVALLACKKTNGDAAQVEAQKQIDADVIQKYIAANNLSTVAKKTIVGKADTTDIWYVIQDQGNGNNYITTSSLLTVGYTGRILTSGKVFAQTDNIHPAYRLGDVIKGWQLGILYTEPKLKKGAKVRLLIASRYAYGPFDQPTLGIPANSVLDFDINIFDVTN